LRYKPQQLADLDFYFVINNVLDRKRIEYFEFDSVLNGVGEQFGRRLWGGFKWQF